MSWTRNEPDPLENRRRQLAEQERLLAEKMSRLTHELEHGNEPVIPEKKTLEPPVWRMEEDSARRTSPEMGPVRKRDLARQRQRDKMLFFLCTALLLMAMIFFIWLWKTHFHTSGIDS